MRKILIALLALCSFTAQADVEVDGVTYRLYSSSASVISVSKEATSVVIPDYLMYEGNGYEVENIKEAAAKDCSNLTSVSIGNNIEYIGISAFEGSGIQYLRIPDKVLTVDIAAFKACPNLRIATVDGSSDKICLEAECFAECKNLEFFSCDKTVRSLCRNAFKNCEGLVSAKFIDVEKTDGWVFENCYNLRSLTAHSMEIGDGMFYECIRLAYVDIFDNTPYLGDWAFAGCKKLRAFDFYCSESIHIGDGCFSGCRNLEKVCLNVPFVTQIGVDAFRDCESLKELPSRLDGVTKICRYAFMNTSITKADLPPTVKYIEDGAFYGCPLTEVWLPEGLDEIGVQAFYLCKDLEKIVIPKSVTEIGDMAFARCEDLSDVTVLWDEPIEIYEEVFEEIDFVNWLHIPTGTYAKYAHATGWSNFTHIEEDASTTVTDAVSEVSENPAKDSPTYNLNGVKSSGKGVVIKNGKKYIVK